jgi:hypothetical protein
MNEKSFKCFVPGNFMPTNPKVEFLAAQGEYLKAKTLETKILALEKMISLAPKHKSSENLLADLRGRLAKLRAKLQEQKKRKKASGKPGIKKEGIQVVLIGLSNSGKSSLLTLLTNARPEINEIEFTTKEPVIGMLDLEGIKFQIVDMPAINHETFDQGLANSADILLIMTTSIKSLESVFPFLEKSPGKRIILFNKIDLLNEVEKRKAHATLQSKKYNFCIISCKTKEGLEDLKKKLIENSGIIRVYTKQPNRQRDEDPVLMKPGSTVEEIARKIFHSNIKIKETRITGPSSKFPNQTVGLKHILQDKDIVEFHTE